MNRAVRRSVWTALAVVGLLGTWFVQASLSRSPRALASRISNLDLPADMEVLEFEDRWTEPNGDGETWIVLQLTEAGVERILSGAGKEGYRRTSTAMMGGRVRSELGAASDVMARQRGDDLTGSIVVIDEAHSRLIVHRAVG